MRKPILMEERSLEGGWPTRQIQEATSNLHAYLKEYVPGGPPNYSKHAIMGPVGKLLPMLASESFGANVESYVGYITNIHTQSIGRPPPAEAAKSLRAGIEELLNLKDELSPRMFKRILESVDYGVYYLKTKEIMERSQAKKAGAGQ